MLLHQFVLSSLLAGAWAQSRMDFMEIRNSRTNNVQLMEPIPISNNFRDEQPVGLFRKVYRSPLASGECKPECDENSDTTACVRPPPTKTERRRAQPPTTFFHWDYADQRGWHRWTHPVGWVNECKMGSLGPTHVGESPINIDPATTIPFELKNGGRPLTNGSGLDSDNYVDTVEMADFWIKLHESWNDWRPQLWIKNNGHSIMAEVCGGNPVDCFASANFGNWPCKLRGLQCNNDTYVLSQLHFHWGMDSSKGSEHRVCGSQRAAEMHMVFINLRWFDMPWDQDDPERGVRFLVLGTFIDEGEFNPAFVPILNSVQPPNPGRGFRERGIVHWANTSGPSRGGFRLTELLPQNYSTHFYTYGGGLTTPPCSQAVTWFVFEKPITWSKSQLEQLRSSTTFYHFPHIHTHPYEAVLFPFVMLMIGALTKLFLSRYATWVPYTMLLMVEGWCLNYLASTNNDGQLNPMQMSIRMWSNIDGHVLLYTFLPALLFGEVMRIKFHTFKQVFWQALVLAGPGVLLGTALTGLFVQYVLPYNWSSSFSMAIGAILSATDPVAVVDLMKHVGASPKLTMQITGESLLNDGTSMILFTILFDLSRNRTYRPDMIIRFCARMFALSPSLGLLIGIVTVFLMSIASLRHSKSDTTVQLALTLSAAYLAFFLGDDSKIAAASGILTVVSAGSVLAWRVWPIVISREALETVWNAIEFIGNTLLFALIGIQMSRAKLSHQIGWNEIYWCLALYVAVFVVRSIVVAVCLPFVNCLGAYKIRTKEAVFVTWSGLRGAVSLALAMFVKQIQSNSIRSWPHDGDADAERILFLIGGVAFLSLLINAPTSGAMLRCFNLIGTDNDVKKPIVERLRLRVVEVAEKTYSETCIRLEHDDDQALAHIDTLCRLKGDLVKSMPSAHHKELGGSAAPTQGYSVEYMRSLVEVFGNVDSSAGDRLAVLRGAFLRCVKAEYWQMIEDGHLPRKALATIRLLESIEIALDYVATDPLRDFEFVGGMASREKEEAGGAHQGERCFVMLDSCVPSCFTCTSEAWFKLTYEKLELAFYVLRAFALAHRKAQDKFVEAVFGPGNPPNSPEEAIVLKESAQEVEYAERRLSEISPNIVGIVKSKIITETVMNAQREAVFQLHSDGLLTEKEAEELQHELDGYDAALKKARNTEMQSITRIAVGQEMIAESLRKVPLATKIRLMGENPEDDLEGNDNPMSAASANEKVPNSIRRVRSRDNLLMNAIVTARSNNTLSDAYDSSNSLSALDNAGAEEQKNNNLY